MAPKAGFLTDGRVGAFLGLRSPPSLEGGDLILGNRLRVERGRDHRALRVERGDCRKVAGIAHAAGGSPRSVGQANGNNPIPIIIPCHRVVATTHLGGYSGGEGLATKRWLLALEAHAQPLLQPIPSAAA